MSNDRRNSAEQLGAGAAMLAASGGLGVYLRHTRTPTIWSATKHAAKHRRLPAGIGRTAAGFAGRRGLQATGLPLVGVGIHGLLGRNSEPVNRLNPRADLVDPAIRHATGADLWNQPRTDPARQPATGPGPRTRNRAVAKLAPSAPMSAPDREQLISRKRRASHIAIAGGVLGLGAGGLRIPQIARGLAHLSPKVRSTRAAGRLIAVEPKLTRASDAVGIASIATGSAGAFNGAGVQRREVKALDTTPSRVAKAGDDRFLSHYRDRISPKAELGYDRLRGDRRSAIGSAVLNTTATAAGADYAAEALKRGRRGWASLGATMVATSGAAAASNVKTARRRGQQMGRIKAKAYERAGTGVYGEGRTPGHLAPEVFKSYIPDVGWKKATAIPKIRLRWSATPGENRYTALRGVTPEHAAARDDMALANAETAHPHGVPVPDAPRYGPARGLQRQGAAGLTVRRGSAKGGASRILLDSTIADGSQGKDIKRGVLTHERAHAAPARSGWRLHGQINTNPRKLGAEEARADAAAGVDYRNRAKITNAGPRDFVSGYAAHAHVWANRRARPDEWKKLGRSVDAGALTHLDATRSYAATQNKIHAAKGTSQSSRKTPFVAGPAGIAVPGAPRIARFKRKAQINTQIRLTPVDLDTYLRRQAQRPKEPAGFRHMYVEQHRELSRRPPIFDKALAAAPPRLPTAPALPKGLTRALTPRVSTVRRVPGGRMVSVRGSIG